MIKGKPSSYIKKSIINVWVNNTCQYYIIISSCTQPLLFESLTVDKACSELYTHPSFTLLWKCPRTVWLFSNSVWEINHWILCTTWISCIKQLWHSACCGNCNWTIQRVPFSLFENSFISVTLLFCSTPLGVDIVVKVTVAWCHEREFPVSLAGQTGRGGGKRLVRFSWTDGMLINVTLKGSHKACSWPA